MAQNTNKLTAIRIKKENNTYSQQIPVSAKVENVRYNNRYSVKDILGNIDMNMGNIQEQIKNIDGVSINNAVQEWLDANPDAPTLPVDASLTQSGAPADAAAAGKLKNLITINEGFINEETKVCFDTSQNNYIDLLTTEDYAYTVTPEMYGAKGDGKTDDSEAIKTALALGENGGVHLIFSNKTYKCANITIRYPTLISGSGNTKLNLFLPDGNLNLSEYDSRTMIFKVQSSNVCIENLQIDIGAIEVFKRIQEGKNENEINSNVNILATFNSYGVQIGDTNNNEYENIIVRNCIIDNYKDAGIQVTKCKNVFLLNNIIGKHKMVGTFNRGIQCIGSKTGSSDSFPARAAYYYISGNQIYNSGQHGIVVYYGNKHTIISNNIIQNAGLSKVNPDPEGDDSYTSGACIKLSGGSDAIISNNICINGMGYGILCAAGEYNTANVHVENNKILYDKILYPEQENLGYIRYFSNGQIVQRYPDNIYENELQVKGSALFAEKLLKGCIINNNIFTNVVVNSSPIINCTCKNALINSNQLINCKGNMGIKYYDEENASNEDRLGEISNNIIIGGDITNGICISRRKIVCNNIISNTSINTSPENASSAIYMNGSTLGHCIISNNICRNVQYMIQFNQNANLINNVNIYGNISIKDDSSYVNNILYTNINDLQNVTISDVKIDFVQQ